MVQSMLEALSYPVVVVKLSTSSSPAPNISRGEDVTAIHEVILPLIGDGKEMAIIARSYSDIPAVASLLDHTAGK